ncbi:hypothetical protein TKK_0019397 [Trichogramma kaykai]|uniref:Uncharacterized protein n=1 Tax=Trichogramma kaykai TaxID=54128 RepID=A0ABD2VT77_9HYME
MNTEAETLSYYKVYVDPHRLTVKVFNGGEDMFPKNFFDECKKAEAERNEIKNLARLISWRLRSSPSEKSRQVIRHLKRKLRYLKREYETNYGITFAKSERFVMLALNRVYIFVK